MIGAALAACLNALQGLPAACVVRSGDELAQFRELKGSHYRVYLNGRQTIFPDHGAKEIGQGLVQKIKKDPGLK